MTRLQKKCFIFSVGMHLLLLLILIGSSAFRNKPSEKNLPILTMIPSRILDEAGAGGGSPEPAAVVQPSAPAPTPAPVAPAPQPTPAIQPQPAPPKPQPAPQEVEREPQPKEEPSPVPAIKPSHKHEIVPDFTPANATTMRSKTRSKPVEQDASAEISPASQARRTRQRIAEALNNLATGVQTSGAAATVVDMPGQGGGEAFVGYETLIYNAYYHAWVTPDSVANKLAATDVKIVVARDGSIISAEIVNKSGERALDKSVERALHDVIHLPAFPEGAQDEQRTFLLRFNLKEKEGAG